MTWFKLINSLEQRLRPLIGVFIHRQDEWHHGIYDEKVEQALVSSNCGREKGMIVL